MAGWLASVSPDRAAQRWVARYNGPGNGNDIAHSVVVSPDGTTVFVTGFSLGVKSGYDIATAAYNAATGTRQWAKRYMGSGSSTADGLSVAVSPTGDTVFVTGYSTGATTGDDYVTVAYNAATGTQRWAKRYNGPGNGNDEARSLAVSPNGNTVFVTGNSTGVSSGDDYATVAYNAATGAQQWVSRYNGPGNGDDEALSMAVRPSGHTVFVTGYSTGVSSGDDYATVAYNAATGAQQWVSRYNGPGNGNDIAHSVTVTPGGEMVFVTGTSAGTTSRGDYATVAYNAATGTQKWVSRYNGPGNSDDEALSATPSPNGEAVFITGESEGPTSFYDYATIAYNAATGAQKWVSRFNGPGNGDDEALSIAVGPRNGMVYITGVSDGLESYQDYATVAYNAATGDQHWVKRYNDPNNSDDAAFSIAVSQTDGTVFVTGGSNGDTSNADYTTIAYTG